MNLCQAISDAKCCSGRLGALYALQATHGEETEELFYDLLRLNSYIRTLQRNEKTFVYKKKVVPLTSVSFCDLIKQKSFLTLRTKTKVVCTKTEIEPCLTEAEICSIIEKTRLLCGVYNCNCN